MSLAEPMRVGALLRPNRVGKAQVSGENADDNAVAPHIARRHAARDGGRHGARGRRRGLSEPLRSRSSCRSRRPAAPTSWRACSARNSSSGLASRSSSRTVRAPARCIATNFVAKSPPDGYTIMMSVSSLAIDATLYKKLPYDPGQGLGAGRADRHGAVRAGRQSVAAGAQRRRSDQARQATAAELRLRRHRRLPSSGRARCSPA